MVQVGRYLKRLGYDGLDGLKRDLRRGKGRTAWQVRGHFESLRTDVREGRFLAELAQAQLDELGRTHALTRSAHWAEAVRLLADSREAYVAAYQNVRGIVQYMSSQLSYARPGAQFLDGLNGTYSEVLDGPPDGKCLVLLDVRRYASKAGPLGLEARAAGVEVVLITEKSCPWAEEVADIRLIRPGSRGPVWDGAASMVALPDMLIANLIIELGDSMNDRGDRLTRLQDVFGDFE